ncbi:hypothetical protein T4C_1099 [Trichinella pseudospiralis]|uniref:Uncharacterized protein n=1 Tax=Trichinella pseudospiralis TaxID=6337 RepID=A0A0V1KCR3_TRIPS|nr:hypothetical protein T4C_1099 [Trichinella pseudospiralis]
MNNVRVGHMMIVKWRCRHFHNCSHLCFQRACVDGLVLSIGTPLAVADSTFWAYIVVILMSA